MKKYHCSKNGDIFFKNIQLVNFDTNAPKLLLKLWSLASRNTPIPTVRIFARRIHVTIADCSKAINDSQIRDGYVDYFKYIPIKSTFTHSKINVVSCLCENRFQLREILELVDYINELNQSEPSLAEDSVPLVESESPTESELGESESQTKRLRLDA